MFNRFSFGLKVLLTTVVLSAASLSVAKAQTGSVTLDLKNVSVKQFFSEIESQTNYSFSFRDVEIESKAPVSINVTNKNLKDVLNQVLSSVGLKYTVVNSKIVVVPVENTAASDKCKLSGRVIDNNGEPIIGAAVMVKGTNDGVITDLDGKFSMTANKEQILTVSALGYEEKQMKVIRSVSDIEFVLSDDYQSLNEAVVVGYGTTLRKNLTTSVATVKTDKISKAANSNVSQLLAGQAAGLRATTASTQPGGAVDISIRGGGTPIFIVDGIMMPSGSLEVGHGSIETPNSVNRAGLAGLNPGDIESVEVLKDASAAIYGINAANGVILITTKKGYEGAPKVSMDCNYSFVRNYPYLEPLTTQEYMNFANIFSKEQYLFNQEMYPYGSNEYDGGWSPVFYPDEIDSATNTQWLDYILRPGYISNNSVTISGGTKYVKYYLGANYYDQEGTVINSGMRRYTLRSNISAQIFPFMKLTSILNINSNSFVNSNADGGGAGGVGKDALQTALMFPPNYSVYDEDGNYQRYRNSTANPAEFTSYKDNTNTMGYYVNFAADINLYKDILTARALYGMNKETGRRSLYIPTTLMWYEVAGVSRGHMGYTDRNDQTIEAMINYKQNLFEIVDLEAVIGAGVYDQSGYGLEVDYKNANDNIAGDNLSAAEGPFTPTSSKWANQKRSQFGRFSADILDRYVVSGTIRRDGSDKFFPGKKYAWFPSASAAWKISNEEWLKEIRWVDLLKLRASYGVTGRDNLGTSLYGVYGVAPSYVMFNNNTTTYIPYLNSGADYPDVTWEKTIMKNIGLDFHFLHNRIWGSVDVFRNDVTDLLGSAPGEPLSMVGTRPVNYGHYYRRGIDATLNSINIKSADFSWSSVLTLTHYNMFWVERQENYDYQEYQIHENEPMNAAYFYHVTGIINEDLSNMPLSQWSLGPNSQKPGYYIIEDKNNDGVITTDDIYMDDVLPKISIGLGNTFTYKNFDLDVFLYGQFGATKYNYAFNWANASRLAYIPAQNSNQYAYNLWNSQTNTDGTLPGIATTKSDTLPGNCGTDFGREDASFVRVRNITFGYNLDGALLGPTFSQRIDNIRFYIDAQNPFTFTKFSGVDPEIYTGNSSSPAGYPMTRSYSLGIKVNFK